MATLAIPPLQLSVEKAPSNPTYRYHLGLAYAKAGDETKAQKALDQRGASTYSADTNGLKVTAR